MSETTLEDLVRRLCDRVGAEAVTTCANGDHDPRTHDHVSGRSIGKPRCWARPRSTADVAAIVSVANEMGVNVTPVGAATTFWDGLRVGESIALDTLSLRAPMEIDEGARTGWFGAGVTLREIDRAARALGLCLASRPDAAGDTPVGSLLSVGTTAGLGMGYGLAVDQIAATTAVTGRGEIVRFGASHMLGGAPHSVHGLPHALGLLAAAEGRAAIVTEVGVALRRAPYIARLTCAREVEAVSYADLAPLLVLAREALDAGGIDTFRVEVGTDGQRASRLEVMVRTFDDVAIERAARAADAIARRLEALSFRREALALETDAARGGIGRDYEMHWSFGVDEHRARLLGGGFWGAELTVPWGSGLPMAIASVLDVFTALRAWAPLHRRLALYPSHRAISVGTQVLAARGTLETVRAVLVDAAPALLRHGVPYRAGGLWRAALDEVLETDHARATRALLETFFRTMDPNGIIGSRTIGAFPPSGSS